MMMTDTSGATRSAAAAAASSSSSSLPRAPLPASSRYTYVVTAQPATIITHTAVCHFTSPQHTNIIIAKYNRLEIFKCVEDGMEAMHEVALYGRIASMITFKAKNDLTDRLFICTSNHKFFVLRWDVESHSLRTDAVGDSKLKIGRLSEQAPLAFIDPTNGWMGLHQYDGLFQMLAIDTNTGNLDKQIYECKFDQLQVIQLAFLYKVAKPTIVVLCLETRDNVDRRSLRSYSYEAKEKEMKLAPQAVNFDQCDNGAAHIIPTQFGGVIVIAEESVSYHFSGSKNPLVLPVSPWQVTAWTAIESTRFLLGDLDGGLYVLLLEEVNANSATAASSSSSSSTLSSGNIRLRVEYLGCTSIAHRLQYIDNGFVLIGSIYGDSQLVQLSAEPVPLSKEEQMEGEGETNTGSAAKNADAMDLSDSVALSSSSSRPNFVRLISSFPNLGSILDLALIDLDRSGQCQLLTASGCFKDGSLRVVRNGIGLTEEASIELEGITGVWGIRGKTNDEFHKYLVQTYASETRMLALEPEEEGGEELALAECEIDGFDSTTRSLFVGNMSDSLLLQITQQSARLIDGNSLQLIEEYKPPAGAKITVATANTQQVLLAMGKSIVLLSLNNQKFKVDAQTVLDEEIACMDITPLCGSSVASYAAVCMWRDNTVRLLNLPQLSEVSREILGDMIARSVLFTQFEASSAVAGGASMTDGESTNNSPCFLLCGLGDGNLVSFEFQPKTAALAGRKKIALGTSGLELSVFQTRGECHVFVSCDRPTVVSTAHGKLRYSNVNLKDVTHMTPFHAPVFRECLALVSASQLMIGHIDEIEKLHIKKVRTNGQPRRLAHQPSSKTIAVVVIEPEAVPTGKTGEINKIKLYDEATFRKLGEFQLDKDEMATSIVSRKLNPATNINATAATATASSSSSSSSSSLSDFYIVGTSYMDPAEAEPSSGRLLIFSATSASSSSSSDDPHLRLVSSVSLKGGVQAVDAIQGRVVAGVNARVVIYRAVQSMHCTPGQFKLERECDYAGNVFVLQIKVSADEQYIFVLDIYSSASVLMYQSQVNLNHVQTIASVSTIEEVARHYESTWATAMDSFSASDDTLIIADHHLNLLTLRRNGDATDPAERARLETLGKWHLGEHVTCISRGSLVMNLPSEPEMHATSNQNADSATATSAAASSSSTAAAALMQADDRVIPTHVFGCVSGAVGVLAPLSSSSFKFFLRLEEALERVVRGVGGLSHRDHRAWRDEKKSEDSSAFIDGDFIELLLELNPKQQEAIATKMGMKAAEIIKRVEDVSRIH